MNLVRKLICMVSLAVAVASGLPIAAAAGSVPPPACPSAGEPGCCCNGFNCETPCEGATCCNNCPCTGPFCGADGPVSISIQGAEAFEGNSGTHPLPFQLARAGRAKEIAVTLQTAPTGTFPATPDFDFEALACTALVPLTTNDSKVAVPVSIIGDTEEEPDETLSIHLVRAIEIVTPQFTETRHGAGEDPYDVRIGDFDGDGRLDLVTANDASGDLSVLLNLGSGTFAAAANYPVGPCPDSVAIGDLNGDDHPDLAVATTCNGMLAVLLGDGTGAFAPALHYDAGGAAGRVLMRELDGNNRPDLVFMDSTNRAVRALLNDGDGGFGPAQTLFSLLEGPTAFDMADVNGDNRLDAVVSLFDVSYRKLSVFMGQAGGGFASAVDYPGEPADFLTRYRLPISTAMARRILQ